MTMRAIRLPKFGGPEVLTLEEIPLPEPGAGEVLVRVAAASVNPVDFKTREGKYPPVKAGDLPITMGRDLAGRVESLGGGNFHKGDSIYALLGRDRGAYAQYAILKEDECALVPKNIGMVEAAAVPLAALTAWQGMFDQGKLRAGQRVLIHGGAGGVGHLAIQFAKAKGAFVATTVSQADLDFARGLGADQVIDYKNQRFEDEVSEIDLVYDLIGGETQERSFAVLEEGGTLVSTLKEPDAAKAKEKNIRGIRYMAQANGGQLAEIAALIEAGAVKVTVAKTFPLEAAAQAQTVLEAGHVRGKIVLTLE